MDTKEETKVSQEAVSQEAKKPEETQTPPTEAPSEQSTEQAAAEAKEQAAVSAKFIESVERQMKAELGEGLPWTPLQKVLGQHMFIKVDQVLKELEKKRNGGDAAYCWQNVNMYKFAIDTVHRVNLELDALIPNHIHPIPYWNAKLQKWDLDLRVGYEGKAFCHARMCVDPPRDVVCKLVHSNERFVPHFKDKDNEYDSYTLVPSEDPFNIGEPIGGFSYIAFDDSRKNILKVFAPTDFAESESYAQTKTFWSKHRAKMMLKTVVHKTYAQLKLDPTKVNPISWLAVQASSDDVYINEFDDDVAERANSEVLSLEQANDGVIETTAVFVQSEEPQKIAVAVEAPKPSVAEEIRF